MAHAQQSSDKGAAFVGLIGGLIFIGAVVYAVSMWTNKRFDAHEGGEAHGAVAVTPTTIVA